MEFANATQASDIARQAALGGIASGGNRSTPLVLGDGLFGQVNGRINLANTELGRIAATLEQAADRVFGCQPKAVSDSPSVGREPFSAAEALHSATEQTHRLIREIDEQVQRLLGGF